MQWTICVLICMHATLLAAQNAETAKQSRVLYYYPNSRMEAPTFSPSFSLSDFLASWWQRTTTTTTSTTPLPPKNCQPCKCGLINMQRRIVGGQETFIHEYPWMAMLLNFGRFYCGGALVNNRYVLTAAHCVKGFRIDTLSVRLLAHNRGSIDPETIDRKINKIIENDGFDLRTFADDIALIQLDRPVEFTEVLRPVCLPDGPETFAGKNGIVTGWGALREGGQPSNSLQQVVVPIISNDECRAKGFRVTNNMLCAGEEGRDACQGDSGGPLLVARGIKYYQVGITSWGDGCARRNRPGVYTRVTSYKNWIMSNTADACYCN